MDLFIESLSGTTYRLRVLQIETVLSIKCQIQLLDRIPVHQQHLLWRSNELSDDRRLLDYLIPSGAKLRLVLSMRGGPINSRQTALHMASLSLHSPPGLEQEAFYSEAENRASPKHPDTGAHTNTRQEETPGRHSSIYNPITPASENSHLALVIVDSEESNNLANELSHSQTMKIRSKTDVSKIKVPTSPDAACGPDSQLEDAFMDLFTDRDQLLLPGLAMHAGGSFDTQEGASSTLEEASLLTHMLRRYRQVSANVWPPEPIHLLKSLYNSAASKVRLDEVTRLEKDEGYQDPGSFFEHLHQGADSTLIEEASFILEEGNQPEASDGRTDLDDLHAGQEVEAEAARRMASPVKREECRRLQEKVATLRAQMQQVQRSRVKPVDCPPEGRRKDVSIWPLTPVQCTRYRALQPQTPKRLAPIPPNLAPGYRPKMGELTTNTVLKRFEEVMPTPRMADSSQNSPLRPYSFDPFRARRTPRIGSPGSCDEHFSCSYSLFSPHLFQSTHNPLTTAFAAYGSYGLENSRHPQLFNVDDVLLESMFPTATSSPNSSLSPAGSLSDITSSTQSTDAQLPFLPSTAFPSLLTDIPNGLLVHPSMSPNEAYELYPPWSGTEESQSTSKFLRLQQERAPERSPNRCTTCHKKTSISNTYVCRCGNIYCLLHRYAELHSCSYDYKAEGRQLLLKNSPLVVSTKVPKI